MHTSNLLGKGNYGSVVSVQSSDGNEFAAKFYKAGQCEVQTGLDVFRQLCHPNIVVAYGVVTSHMEVGLLLEKGCGNFGKYLRGLPLREPLDPKKVFQRWQLSSQLAQGLRHVHSRGLVHGDPKPSNAIVFEAPLAAKWSDFGLSHKIGEKVLSENVYIAVYRAPELVSGKVVRLKQSADAFAFGCVLFSSCCVGSSAHLFPEVSLLGNQQFVRRVWVYPCHAIPLPNRRSRLSLGMKPTEQA